MRSVLVHELVGKIRHFHSLKQSVCAVVFHGHACEMEVQSEHVTTEKDEIQVMQKVMDLAKKAKELGFSIKQLELESEEDESEKEEKSH